MASDVFVPRRLSCLAQQTAKEPRAMFAYMTDPFTLARASLQGIEADKGDDLFLSSESHYVDERMNQSQGRQQTDPWMCLKELHPSILIRLFLQFGLKSCYLAIELFIDRKARGDQKPLGVVGRSTQKRFFSYTCFNAEFVQSRGPRKCLQLVRDRRALSHQRLSVIEKCEHRPVFFASRRYSRKLAGPKQIQYRFGIPKIILVPRECCSTDHLRIADLKRLSIVKEHLFEPSETARCLDPDARVRTAFAVKRDQRLLVVMSKLLVSDLSVRIIKVRYRLLIGMKINADV